MNILTGFLETAARYADRPAIIEASGRTARFGELVDRSAAVARHWQSHGVRAGDRALLAMPLGIDLYVGLAALWRIGAVAVFPEPALGLPGLRHAARVTQPAALLTGGWYRALTFVVPELWRVRRVLRVEAAGGVRGDGPIAAVPADAPALISFTSGSTGAPKAIVRSHGFLAAQNAAVFDLIAPTRAHETDLVAFPVFVVANLALGITSVLPNWNLRRHHEAKASGIVAHIRTHGVSRALVPPSICETLALSGQSASLQSIFTGGGPVFPDMIVRLQELNPESQITAVYGSTEAEPIAHLHVKDIGAADWQAMREGAGLLTGAPSAQVKLRLRDDEIVVTGDHVNKGYLDPTHDATTKLALDGEVWHRTGDAGRLDAQGRLWLLGRHEGRIDGLYPFTVETAARFWPGVKRSALTVAGGRAALAIEGDHSQEPLWRREAEKLGVAQIRPVGAIPLDKRHRSKVDYRALKEMLARG
jgi:acyl-CoA synthetase (AMP-forming)/AMP-acid ligase II